jgi:hypothetical protein
MLREPRALALAAAIAVVAPAAAAVAGDWEIEFQDFLRELAATTGGEEWRADYGQLRDVLLKALDEFRSRYTLRDERQGVARAGWHEFEVRVRRPGVKVRARSGYVEEEDRGAP